MGNLSLRLVCFKATCLFHCYPGLLAFRAPTSFIDSPIQRTAAFQIACTAAKQHQHQTNTTGHRYAGKSAHVCVCPNVFEVLSRCTHTRTMMTDQLTCDLSSKPSALHDTRPARPTGAPPTAALVVLPGAPARPKARFAGRKQRGLEANWPKGCLEAEVAMA